MSEDQAKRVQEDRKRYDERRAEMAQPVDADEVRAKAGDREALTLEELVAVNEPPKRAHNDEADIGKRYEGSDYAPAAQPDLSAPAYVLATQARLLAEGKDDNRMPPAVAVEDPAVAEDRAERQAEVKAEKRAETKTDTKADTKKA